MLPYQIIVIKNIGESLINLQNEDLLKFGMIPEFIGRLPVCTTLHELNEKNACTNYERTKKCYYQAV